MKPQRNKPALYSRKAEGQTLSVPVLIELMQAVLDKSSIEESKFRRAPGVGLSMTKMLFLLSRPKIIDEIMRKINENDPKNITERVYFL